VLDIALIRERPDFVKAEIAKLNGEAPIDRIVELDQERRSLLVKVEALRQERNSVSKEIGRMKDPEERQAKITEMRQVSDRISELDEQLRQVESEFNEARERAGRPRREPQRDPAPGRGTPQVRL
jgi:seryl-tRNA synthetase